MGYSVCVIGIPRSGKEANVPVAPVALRVDAEGGSHEVGFNLGQVPASQRVNRFFRQNLCNQPSSEAKSVSGLHCPIARGAKAIARAHGESWHLVAPW